MPTGAESPDQFRARVGRCPPGFQANAQQKCQKTGSVSPAGPKPKAGTPATAPEFVPKPAPSPLAQASPQAIDRAKAKGGLKLKPQWKEPKLDANERGEIERVADEEGLNKKDLIKAWKKGQIKELDDEAWSELENTDSWETDSMKKVAKLADEYDRDWRRVVDGFAKGAKMPASIVLQRKDGSKTLVGGNTRLMVARALGIRPVIKQINLESRQRNTMKICEGLELEPATFHAQVRSLRHVSEARLTRTP